MLIEVLLLKATVNLGEVKCYSFAFSAKYLQPVITALRLPIVWLHCYELHRLTAKYNLLKLC